MIRTSALVIRTADFKDTDRMLTLLTKDYGLLSAKVRAAKKQTSKLFCSSNLFCCGEYEFYEKGGYYGVRGCEITHSFQKLPESYEAFSAACFITDAAGKAAQEDFPEPKLYALVVNALYALETGADPDTIVCYFMQRLLYIEGIYPETNVCVMCGNGSVTHFSAEHGGAVCEACAAVGSQKHSAAALKALRAMEDVVPVNMGKLRISADALTALKKLLLPYLESALSTPIKAAKFL